MKKLAYLLAIISLLTTHSIAFAGQAINISVSNPDGIAITDSTDAIHQTVGDAISKGIIKNFITYNHGFIQTDKFYACAEAADNISTTDFNSFVGQLRNLAIGNFTLKYAKQCQRDNTFVCSDDSVNCLSNAFVTSAAYSMYMARKQFTSGLADITAGKAALELLLDKGVMNQPSVTDIGLQPSTKNCSVITIDSFDAAGGTAAITCTIQGNSIVLNKNITWTRTPDGAWSCSSTIVDTNFTAGQCN
ncbi:MAG: pilin [Methylococcaceae bacterium]